jgi:hypothetical protein
VQGWFQAAAVGLIFRVDAVDRLTRICKACCRVPTISMAKKMAIVFGCHFEPDEFGDPDDDTGVPLEEEWKQGGLRYLEHARAGLTWRRPTPRWFR